MSSRTDEFAASSDPDYVEGHATGYNDARAADKPKRIRTRQKAHAYTKGYWDGWNRVVDEKARGMHQ